MVSTFPVHRLKIQLLWLHMQSDGEHYYNQTAVKMSSMMISQMERRECSMCSRPRLGIDRVPLSSSSSQSKGANISSWGPLRTRNRWVTTRMNSFAASTAEGAYSAPVPYDCRVGIMRATTADAFSRASKSRWALRVKNVPSSWWW